MVNGDSLLIKEKINKKMIKGAFLLLMAFLISIISVYYLLITLTIANSPIEALIINAVFIPFIVAFIMFIIIDISSSDDYRSLELYENGILFPKKWFYWFHKRNVFIPMESIDTIHFEKCKLNWGYQYLLIIKTKENIVYRKGLGYFVSKKKITDNNEKIFITIQERWPNFLLE